MESLQSACLVFPYSKINANAISSLIATLDIHPILKDLKIILPNQKENPEFLGEELFGYKSIILAFSVYSTQFESTVNLIKKYNDFLKKKNLLVIAGGPHPTGNPRSMLVNGVDIVCVGEGEFVFSKIILEFLQNSNFDRKKIPGISYLVKGNKIIKTTKPLPVNLDDFPPFSVKHNLFRPIEITRGCAWKCRFCQVRSKGVPVRHRSIDQILKYIKITLEKFHQRRPDIRFISPNALSFGSKNGKDVNLDKIEELLFKIRKLIGHMGKIYFGSFPSEIRPETISEASAKILKKYTNSSRIIIGGQSGSNKVLEFVDRGHNYNETERAVKLLTDLGFEVDVDIIFGLPGEEEEDIQLTISHIKQLTDMGARIHGHTFMPLVGTPFAASPAKKINSQYIQLITNLHHIQKISGVHLKQEIEAEKMARRRNKGKEQANAND